MRKTQENLSLQVDVGCLQPLEAVLATGAHILWASVYDLLSVLIADAKLGSNGVLLSIALDGLACVR